MKSFYFPAMHRMNMNCFLKYAALVLISLQASNNFAQEGTLLPDKQGTFKVIIWSIYSSSASSFSKTETEANYKKLVAITDEIRKNPVMNPPRGFDCNARLYARDFDYNRRGYGIPCNMSLEFCYFFIDKYGKEAKVEIEPPHWDMEINRLKPFGINGFNYTTPDPPRGEKPKAGFDYEEWNNIGNKINDLLMPGKKEIIAKGLDRYADELVVIYNPDRPAYWLPVSVREVYTLLIDYWKLHWNKIQSDFMTKFLQDEYAQISASDRDRYLDGTPFAGTVSINPEIPVMRINPEYWNKNLPRSAVQIISFSYLDDKNFYGSSHTSRFLQALDIKTLIPLVDK